MDGARLQNLISKGLGVGARRAGTPFIVYRPRSICAPLSSRNRVIKLYAAFSAQDQSFRRVAAYGDAVWWGAFDSLYTQPGDYLSAADPCSGYQVFFIAAQRPLLPAQCIRTNRIVNVSRPPAPGLGGYGGMVAETAVVVIDGWPASLLSIGARVSGSLPETRYGMWSMLLPSLPDRLLAGDIVTDDTGRSFLTASAEQSDLGWRVSMRQVAG
jgi:hypothetical protein